MRRRRVSLLLLTAFVLLSLATRRQGSEWLPTVGPAPSSLWTVLVHGEYRPVGTWLLVPLRGLGPVWRVGGGAGPVRPAHLLPVPGGEGRVWLAVSGPRRLVLVYRDGSLQAPSVAQGGRLAAFAVEGRYAVWRAGPGRRGRAQVFPPGQGGTVGRVLLTPDGRWAVYAEEGTGGARVRIRRVDGAQDRVLAGALGETGAWPAGLAGARDVAVQAADGRVYLARLPLGAVRVVPVRGQVLDTCARGGRLAILEDGGQKVAVVDARGRARAAPLPAGLQPSGLARFSPGGHRLALLGRRHGQDVLAVVDLQPLGWRSRLVVPPPGERILPVALGWLAGGRVVLVTAGDGHADTQALVVPSD